jgi:hypothetical protein
MGREKQTLHLKMTMTGMLPSPIRHQKRKRKGIGRQRATDAKMKKMPITAAV